MSLQEIHRRYPRLLKMCQQVAILSRGEAINAISSHQFGTLGCEAVCHFGGPKKVIQQAWKMRHWYKELWQLSKREGV
jgi:hypothetical protein